MHGLFGHLSLVPLTFTVTNVVVFPLLSLFYNNPRSLPHLVMAGQLLGVGIACLSERQYNLASRS